MPRAWGDSEDIQPANLAPDLADAGAVEPRVDRVEWLKNPARIQPGTGCRVLAELSEVDFPQLGNNADAQIQAIRDHLLTMRGGPSPLRPQTATAVRIRTRFSKTTKRTKTTKSN